MDRTQLLKLGKISIALATLVPLTGFGSGGTRMIPPPPPRYPVDDTVQQTSTWGTAPNSQYSSESRFGAMEDDEGREVEVGDSGSSYHRGRSPAGLEVGAAKPATNRPTLESSKVSRTEEQQAEAVRKKVIEDLADPVTRRKGVQEVALIAGDLGFFPKTFFVSRDVPVRLYVTGTAKGSLCLMMDSFNVRKQVRTSKIEEITFTPTQAGTYRFYCPVNGSEGTMVVKELTTETDSAVQ